MHTPKTAASSYLRFTGLLLALAYLVWMNIRNQLPVDAGDGILHYSIAQQSWNESYYFLDHWGKPLFTLFSSAFAQVGFKAYIVFNLLVFTINCLLVFSIFRRLNVATFYYVLFPLFLICVPDYAYCLLGGMTEPLFGLLLTAAIYFAFRQQWNWFAIIVSFTPFARSEGMLVVVLAGLLLLITGFLAWWRQIPGQDLQRRKAVLRLYKNWSPVLLAAFCCVVYAFVLKEGVLLILLASVLFVITSFIVWLKQVAQQGLNWRKELLRLYKHWSPIPLLAFGFVIYAIAGWWLLDSPLWYFKNNPYPENSIYGTGPWWWYLSTWKNHFGLITLTLLPFGIFGCIVLWKKKLIPNFVLICLFAIGVYAGIVIIHSYLWHEGRMGSAGLTRIATLGLPVMLLLIVIGCHFVTKELNSIPHIVTGLGVCLLIGKEIRELPYPLTANPLEQTLIDAADYVQATYPGKRTYYFHPLIPWRLNVGIKDNGSNLEQRYFHRLPKMVVEMQTGGILIRDPQFGPVEQGLPLDFVDSFKRVLVPVKVFHTKEPYSVYTGEEPQVVVYEVQ